MLNPKYILQYDSTVWDKVRNKFDGDMDIKNNLLM